MSRTCVCGGEAAALHANIVKSFSPEISSASNLFNVGTICFTLEKSAQTAAE